MKQCPKCKTTYSDDTLRFCLVDGANLHDLPDAEKTVEMSGGTRQMRVPPQETLPTFVSPAKTAQPTRQGINPWIVLPPLAILFIAVVGLVGYILLQPAEKIAVKDGAPAPTATAAPDSETAALKEELESLKKQVKEQKNQDDNPTAQPLPQDQPIIQTARVNSPNDGFLALRSIPDSEIGERLAKIPHGTNLEIVGCQKSPVKIGSRRGRWCRTSYERQTGWVFDAWLAY